jgi:hypothetical protein
MCLSRYLWLCQDIAHASGSNGFSNNSSVSTYTCGGSDVAWLHCRQYVVSIAYKHALVRIENSVTSVEMPHYNHVAVTESREVHGYAKEPAGK